MGKKIKLPPFPKEMKQEINPETEMNSIEQQAAADNFSIKQQAISDVIDKVQEEFGINIGVQLDTAKIKAILDYMIDNQLTTVSLKYEIWKDQQ